MHNRKLTADTSEKQAGILYHLLSAGNIVILDGYKKQQIILRLTDEILTDNFIECVKRGYYKIKQADNLEKAYWFDGYDKQDCFALPMSKFKEWLACR